MSLRHAAGVTLPDWIPARITDWMSERPEPGLLRDDEACMALVLDLARGNVARSTGGPFSAALRDDATGELVSVGVNLVMPARCSVLHAEVVALLMGAHSPCAASGMTLFSSCEPCIMCLGALHWSGVPRIVFSALREDAEAIGFSEGAGVSELKSQMRLRGVSFTEGVLRTQGVEILRAYKSKGSVIYGPGGGGST